MPARALPNGRREPRRGWPRRSPTHGRRPLREMASTASSHTSRVSHWLERTSPSAMSSAPCGRRRRRLQFGSYLCQAGITSLRRRSMVCVFEQCLKVDIRTPRLIHYSKYRRAGNRPEWNCPFTQARGVGYVFRVAQKRDLPPMFHHRLMFSVRWKKWPTHRKGHLVTVVQSDPQKHTSDVLKRSSNLEQARRDLSP